MRNSLGYFIWGRTSAGYRENWIALLLLWISAGAQPQRAFACSQLASRGTPCKSHLPGKQLHPCSTLKHSQGRWGWGELRLCPAALVQPTQQWPYTFSDCLLFGNSSPLKLCAQMPAFTSNTLHVTCFQFTSLTTLNDLSSSLPLFEVTYQALNIHEPATDRPH